MSSRFNLKPQLVANAVSLNQDGYSIITNINSISEVGYTLSWTAGAVGALQVEVSNDYAPASSSSSSEYPNPGTWVAIPLLLNGTTVSTTIAVSGSAGSAYVDIVGISAAYIRVHFVYSSGTGGSFSATLAGKVA